VSARSAHLSELILEQLAEGSLPEGEAATARAHVETCDRCSAELNAYRALFAVLGELPRFAPSPAFADAVMARVRIAPQEHPWFAWLRRLAPRTGRAWALLGVLATAPALPIIALFAWLLTQPLLTPAVLGEWTLMRTQAAAQALFAGLLEGVHAWGVVGQIESVYAALRAVPAEALGGAVLFLGLAMPLSAWGLIRLTRTPMRRVTHAN
jgi:anti-sigma factor RsiW